MTRNDKKRAARLAHDLMGAFDWETTPQGYTYWSDVERTLSRLAGGVKPYEGDEVPVLLLPEAEA